MTTIIPTFPVFPFEPATVVDRNGIAQMHFLKSKSIKIDNLQSTMAYFDTKLRLRVQEALEKFEISQRYVDFILIGVPKRVVGQQPGPASSGNSLSEMMLLICKGDVLQALISSFNDHQFEFEAKVSCLKSGRSFMIKKGVTINHPLLLNPAVSQIIGLTQGNNIHAYVYDGLLSAPQETSTIAVTDVKIVISLPAKSKQEGQGLITVLSKMLDDKSHCDFKITSNDGETFKIHRSVLAVQSDVFQTMLAVREKPTIEASTGILTLKDMSGKGLRLFVEYLYKRSMIPENSDLTIVFELLNAGNRYHIDHLMDEAATFLIKWSGSINKEGDVKFWLDIFEFASSLSNINELINDLKIKSAINLHNNPTFLKESEVWKKFSNDHPQSTNELLFFMMEMAKSFGNVC